MTYYCDGMIVTFPFLRAKNNASIQVTEQLFVFFMIIASVKEKAVIRMKGR